MRVLEIELDGYPEVIVSSRKGATTGKAANLVFSPHLFLRTY